MFVFLVYREFAKVMRVTHPMSEGAESYGANGDAPKRRKQDGAMGPDPAVGAGIALIGIFLMGMGGASDIRYVYDFGFLVAIIGAALFVSFATVSAMKQRREHEEEGEPPR